VTDWHAPFIERAIVDKLIEGLKDGTFRPFTPLTRAEAARAIYQMIVNDEEELENEETPLPGVFTDEELKEEVFAAPKACLVSGTPPTPSFIDINEHWAYPMIQRLARTRTVDGNRPLTQGYLVQQGDRMQRTFKPDQYITRFELLKLSLLSNCTPLITHTEELPYSFADVFKVPRLNEHTDQRQKREIIYSASELSIVQGYPDGNFRPDALVTRAEAVKILIRAAGLPAVEVESRQFFRDVPLFEWYAPYVHQAATYGLVSGYGDGTFRPAQLVTRAEMAKMINIIIASSGRMPDGFNDPVSPLHDAAASELSFDASQTAPSLASSPAPQLPGFTPETRVPELVGLRPAAAPEQPLGARQAAAPEQPQTPRMQPAQLLAETVAQNREDRKIKRESLDEQRMQQELEEGRERALPAMNQCLIDGGPLRPGFIDVSAHWSQPIVQRLARARINHGSEPLIQGELVQEEGQQYRYFFPDRQITRYEFVKLAVLSNCLPIVRNIENVAVTFRDTPKRTRATEPEAVTEQRLIIYTAAHFDLVRGHSDGTFRGDEPMTRVEALKILLRAANVPPVHPDTVGIPVFSDVPDYEWYAPYVRTAVYEGFANGYRDNTFHPAALLTRAEAAKMVDIAMRREPTREFPEVAPSPIPSPFDTEQELTSPAPEPDKAPDLIEDARLADPNMAKPAPNRSILDQAQEVLQGITAEQDVDTALSQFEEQEDPNVLNECLIMGQPLMPGFSDVSGHWAEPMIRFLSRARREISERPLLDGYKVMHNGVPERIFAPNKPITRYELLRFALMSNCVELVRDVQDVSLRFTDVPKTTFLTGDEALERRIIYTAADLGIIRGYRDGYFRPDAPISRAEALKVLILAAELPPMEGHAAMLFSDVPLNEWYASYVERAAFDGLISGFADGSFHPEEKITRAEALKIVYLMLRQ